MLKRRVLEEELKSASEKMKKDESGFVNRKLYFTRNEVDILQKEADKRLLSFNGLVMLLTWIGLETILRVDPISGEQIRKSERNNSKKKKSAMLFVSIDSDTHEKLRMWANFKNAPISDIVRDAINKYINQQIYR